MFPVTDFNFMVAGIATVAATVGYTYARGKFNTPTWVPSVFLPPPEPNRLQRDQGVTR